MEFASFKTPLGFVYKAPIYIKAPQTPPAEVAIQSAAADGSASASTKSDDNDKEEVKMECIDQDDERFFKADPSQISDCIKL